MRTCAIISCDCNSASKDAQLFRIPIEEEEAKGWIRFITEANSGVAPRASPGRYIFVCSKHFRSCCIYPFNPRYNRIIAGHYPSVFDGKVIENPSSRCADIAAEENLQVYTPPRYHSVHDIQHAYLVNRLTSFNVPRKIVIGNESKKKNSVGKKMDESCSPQNFQDQDEHQSEKDAKNVEVPLLPVKQQAINAQIKPRLSTAKKMSWSTRPSAETKMKLLIRDNINLKKSVRTLEKRVEEMEKDVKKFKDASSDLEMRYKKLFSDFQKKKRRDNKSGRARVNCKCVPIEVVDIC